MRGAHAKPVIRRLRRARWTPAAVRSATALLACTHLGDAILESLPVSRVSWSAPVDASDASVDSAGSCIDALLPCRCSRCAATVELLDDGRERSRPTSSGLMDGSVLWAGAGGDVVLMAGRSNACSIDGRRNVSWACGRGRIEEASAEAVVDEERETRRASLGAVLQM
ncbi:hypothetical protein SVAN01_04837 [Stagonosporopsis vannaccii]|nr:hypothetical protein SVAN01_04837 [Stagonosporopsis vannaccii]